MRAELVELMGQKAYDELSRQCNERLDVPAPARAAPGRPEAPPPLTGLRGRVRRTERLRAASAGLRMRDAPGHS